MTGHQQGIRMPPPVMLPTEGFDYERSALKALYERVNDYPDLALDELRARLRELPCCATNADGHGEGDPLNVVIVGTDEDTILRWRQAAGVSSRRFPRTACDAKWTAAVASDPGSYPVSAGQQPATPSAASRMWRCNGRAARVSSQRNHMRLWLAPFSGTRKPIGLARSGQPFHRHQSPRRSRRR